MKVIAAPRHTGKTTLLLDMALKDHESILAVTNMSQAEWIIHMIMERDDLDQEIKNTFVQPGRSWNRSIQHPQSRIQVFGPDVSHPNHGVKGGNYYVDNAEFLLTRYLHNGPIKAVTMTGEPYE